jgi:hypothetical protein
MGDEIQRLLDRALVVFLHLATTLIPKGGARSTLT